MEIRNLKHIKRKYVNISVNQHWKEENKFKLAYKILVKSNSYRFWKFWAWKIKRHFRKVLGTSKLSDSFINFFFPLLEFTILILPSIFKATDCNRNDTHNTISICLLFAHVKESSIGILLTSKSVWRKFLLRILIVLLLKKFSHFSLFKLEAGLWLLISLLSSTYRWKEIGGK